MGSKIDKRPVHVLGIIDIQVDFTTGSLANPDAVAIIPAIIDRIDKVEKGDIIIATRDTHTAEYLNTQEGKRLPVEHCIEYTEGQLIVPEIMHALYVAKKRGVDVQIIDKPTFGSLDWNERLRYNCDIDDEDEIEDVTLVGTCTGICVISNAVILKASLPETPIVVVANECACVSPESHKIALEAMKLMQIEVIE